MSGRQHSRTRNPELSAFRALLRLYPGEFRDEYGREMAMVLSDRYRDAASSWERSLIAMEAIIGVLSHAPKEHFHMILRDLPMPRGFYSRVGRLRSRRYYRWR
jgi:hypothetical protein